MDGATVSWREEAAAVAAIPAGTPFVMWIHYPNTVTSTTDDYEWDQGRRAPLILSRKETMCYFAVSTATGCAILTQAGLPPASGATSGQTGQTIRQSTTTNIAVGDLIEFRRVGNVFTA